MPSQFGSLFGKLALSMHDFVQNIRGMQVIFVRICMIYRILEIKAYSHQGYPLTYELTTDTGQQSNEFAIDSTTGVVDLLRQLDYEKDPHQYHLKAKVVESGRPARSSAVNVRFFIYNQTT